MSPLDSEQMLVSSAPTGSRYLVLAPPGSGKTEVVSARISSLLEQGISASDVLVISFSHAAVHAVRQRQRRAEGTQWVWVSTLDSLATRFLSDAGIDVAGMSFDKRIERFNSALDEGLLDDVIPCLSHLVADEFQDVIGPRQDMLVALLRSLSNTAGFTVLGDPGQCIYGFQRTSGERLRHSLGLKDEERIPAVCKQLGASEVHLMGQYRAESRDAKRASQLSPEGRDIAAWQDEMQEFGTSLPNENLSEFADLVDRLPGTAGLLTYSNADALVVTDQLHRAGLAATLSPRSTERSLAPWVARALSELPESVSRERFLSEWQKEGLPGDGESEWYALRRNTHARTRFLRVDELASRLSAGYVPASLESPMGSLTVSTVHRAKGLEFDFVALVDLLNRLDHAQYDDIEDLARILYVAVSRSRRLLVRTSVANKRWLMDERTDRALRLKYDWPTGVEFRPSDLHTQMPPGCGDDVVAVQALLRSFDGVPQPIEWRLNPRQSTLDVPVYNAYLNGLIVGATNEQFGGLLHTLYGRVHRPDIQPILEGGHMFGTETVAGPRQDGPVGRNGLWLAPLIGGPLTLRDSRSSNSQGGTNGRS